MLYAPLDPKFRKFHDEAEKRTEDLERRYPKAATDDFQKGCALWELLYGGKSIRLVDCPNRDVEKTIESFRKMFGIFSGLESGIATQAVSDSPEGPATGFHILCYEKEKDAIKKQLILLGILDSEIHWIPESELIKQFEEWKQKQSKQVKATSRCEKRKKRATNPNSHSNASNEADLFELVVEETQVHPAFKALRDLEHFEGARELMSELYRRMRDPNGNFVHDFQSYGYHARIFELACFGYLESLGFTIDRSYPSPDFLVSTGKNKYAVEAATASPSVGLNTDISLSPIINQKMPSDDLFKKTTNEFPIKMGNLLLKKLKMKYWLLPQCKDIPIVFLVSPLYEPGSIFNIDDALARYLYGGWDEFPFWVNYKGILTHQVPIKSHKYNGKELESNFFSRPSSRHISAVIFSNTFTENKFVRMAMQMGLDSKFQAIKQGTCLLKNQYGEISIQDYEYRVRDKTAPKETWYQGLTVFHNPNALFPIPDNLLKSTNIYRIVNGKLVRSPSDFHPLTTFTIVHPA